MDRWRGVIRPPLVVSLLVLVASAVGISLLHGTVVACTVGFNNSNEPLGAGPASQCLGAEIGAAVLIAVALLAGAIAVWIIARAVRAHPDSSSATPPGPPAAEGGERSQFTQRWLERIVAWPAFNWVCLMVALFVVVTFFAESWSYLQLHGETNIYDLSINQQALSSTILGNKPYTMYEAINCGRHGQCSFLLVHQAFVAFAVALIYGLAPTPFTLFSLQTLALGLGALPLYFLATDVIRSRGWSLVAVGTYLVWVPLFMMASNDSFHWEAFLPVELITIFWLWNRQRYLVAAPVVLLSFLTEEVAPVLAFFIGLYFLWPWLVRAIRIFWVAITVPSDLSPGSPSRIRLWFRWMRTALRAPEVYASLALLIGSIVAYVLLRLFEQDGAWLLGVPPPLSTYSLGIGSPNKAFVFGYGALSFDFGGKVWYWIVIFLTLGLIPFFAPRSLLLAFPWAVLTFFNTTRGFWSFGNQYAVVPAAALLIGFTLGLGRLVAWTSTRSPRSVASSSAAVPAPNEVTKESDSTSVPRRRRWRPRLWRTRRPSPAVVTLSVLVAAIIVANLFLNPFNPLASKIVPNLGAPFPRPYGIDGTPPPDNSPLMQLVSLIPKNAIVAAPLPVYSLVADDPYAYPLAHWSNPPLNLLLLPGNESANVAFVVLPYDTPIADLSAPLNQTLYDWSDFQVRGCVSDSSVGGVELFERNYTGPAEVYGPADSLCPNYFSGGFGLTAGPDAIIQSNASSLSGTVIRAAPCSSSASFFSGPNVTLSPGRYAFNVVYTAVNCTGTGRLPGNTTELSVAAVGTGPSGTKSNLGTTIFNVNATKFNKCGGWHCGAGTFALLTSTLSLSLIGAVETDYFEVQVAYLTIVPLT